MAQKTFSPISEAQIKKASIATLADRPNSVSRYGDGGLSAQELKERFDAFPALVQKKINEIIEALASGEAAKYITLNEKSNVLQRDNLYDFIALFCADNGDNETIADFIEALYTMDGEKTPDSYSLKEIFADITARFATINADVSKASSDIAAQRDRIATNEQKTQENAQNIASMQQAITQRDTQISSHEERITGIERYLGGDNFIVDDSTAYEKTVPKNACEKAKVLSIGGMTYKKKTDDGNLMPYPYVGTGGLGYTVDKGAVTITGIDNDSADFIISNGDGTVYPAGTYIFEVGEQSEYNVLSLGLEFSNYTAEPSVTKRTNYKYLIASEGSFSITQFVAQIAGEATEFTLYPMFYKSDAPITWQPRGYWLSHTKVKAIESKGVAIWNEQWEIGSYGSNGEPIEQSGIRSKAENYITVEPSTDYYIYNGTSSWVVLLFYDANKQYISSAEVQSGIRTTPINAKYMRFRLSSDYGTTYNNDVSIYKSDATMNGKYYPYVGTIDTFTIPEAVQAREGYGAGTPDGNNHIYYGNNGRAYYSKPIKVYEFTGDEDLGEYNSTAEFFRCVSSAVDDAMHWQTNALCSHLPLGDFANSFSIDSGSSRFSFRFAYNFFVSGETTTAERVEAVRRWLKEQKAQGTPVTIVYSLQTPPADEDITDIMPEENLIKVLGGCRIAAENEQSDPVPFSIKYLVTYPKGG